MVFSQIYFKMVIALAISANVIRSFSITMRSRLTPGTQLRFVAKLGPSTRLTCSSYSALHMVADSSLSTTSSISSLMKPSSQGTQFVFVGGKGGVGKTSSSSAIAIAFSDAGFRTLLVSTDPAHSLGDALDVNLRSGNVIPITTENNLWALEIDVDAGDDKPDSTSLVFDVAVFFIHLKIDPINFI